MTIDQKDYFFNPRKEIDRVFEEIFSYMSPDARQVFVYVQRILNQYGLARRYDPSDVLIEVYSRAVKITNSGEKIRLPLPWIRRTAVNVVREVRRESERIEHNEDFLDKTPYYDDFLSEITLQCDLKAMRQAFERLDAEDQNILRLRVINRLSWRDVRESLAMSEEIESNQEALRQRGFRALKKLRKLYEEESRHIKLHLDN